MFEQPLFFASQHIRAGGAQTFSEFVATFGLLSVIWGCRSSAAPFAMGAYITGAYLVHRVDVVRESGRHARPRRLRHVRRNPARRCPRVRRRSTRRRGRRYLSIPMANLDKKRVLILCTGNSARSQMAEGLLRHDAGDRFAVESAGTRPSQVRPEAIAVMRELGIDISGHRSKHVDEFAGQEFDYILTVCDNAKRNLPGISKRKQPASITALTIPLARRLRYRAPGGISGAFATRSAPT